jgi:hypothetical protein
MKIFEDKNSLGSTCQSVSHIVYKVGQECRDDIDGEIHHYLQTNRFLGEITIQEG